MLRILRKEMRSVAEPKRAQVSLRFFKTGIGEYGEGDVFIGITMSVLRTIAKKYQDLSLADVTVLLYSKVHEERMIALRFEDFKTINGPNLHLYLAKDLRAKDFIDLGPIRGTSGNINYLVPEGIDITEYRYLMHWCVPFRVLFNYADLNQI